MNFLMLKYHYVITTNNNSTKNFINTCKCIVSTKILYPYWLNNKIVLSSSSSKLFTMSTNNLKFESRIQETTITILPNGGGILNDENCGMLKRENGNENRI